ncbi:MAG: alpha/beta fold hydrolase [Chloroflexota bacterium]|nr:alpha/beta fold hydrolase [Chloroflexota bacterium]
MPYATNDGTRIYYEREGSGPPLVLQHGFTRSLEGWRDSGYVDALKNDYELILLDARGHGRSDKPHDPAAYAYDKRAADVLAVLDDAGIARAIFWGYSMGGHIGYAIGQYAPGRFDALILGGMHPYARDPAQSRQRAEAIRSGGIAQYVADGERREGPLPPQMRARVLANNDSEALAAATIASGDAPSFDEALANLRIPVLIYAGDRDQPIHDEAARAATGKQHVQFVTLPGLNHGEGSRRSDVVLPHVRAFLAGIKRSA